MLRRQQASKNFVCTTKFLAKRLKFQMYVPTKNSHFKVFQLYHILFSSCLVLAETFCDHTHKCLPSKHTDAIDNGAHYGRPLTYPSPYSLYQALHTQLHTETLPLKKKIRIFKASARIVVADQNWHRILPLGKLAT